MSSQADDAQIGATWNKEYLRLKHTLVGRYFDGTQDTPSGSTSRKLFCIACIPTTTPAEPITTTETIDGIQIRASKQPIVREYLKAPRLKSYDPAPQPPEPALRQKAPPTREAAAASAQDLQEQVLKAQEEAHRRLELLRQQQQQIAAQHVPPPQPQPVQPAAQAAPAHVPLHAPLAVVQQAQAAHSPHALPNLPLAVIHAAQHQAGAAQPTPTHQGQ